MKEPSGESFRLQTIRSSTLDDELWEGEIDTTENFIQNSQRNLETKFSESKSMALKFSETNHPSMKLKQKLDKRFSEKFSESKVSEIGVSQRRQKAIDTSRNLFNQLDSDGSGHVSSTSAFSEDEPININQNPTAKLFDLVNQVTRHRKNPDRRQDTSPDIFDTDQNGLISSFNTAT